jgi:hypothetical protein
VKQHWQIAPVPPPDDSTAGLDGFVSFALLAFGILAPLIYFGAELRAVEAWIIEIYSVVENGLSHLRGVIIG